MPQTPDLARFAHRGASSLAPENTLDAFETALEHGCHWIETDLRITADGRPILLHDDTVDRTTDGRGAINRLSLSEARRLDAGGWFDSRFRNSRIPTLEEALDWALGRCGMNLEIKETERTGVLIEAMADRMASRGESDQILFSSFRIEDLRRLRAALPRARLAWLVSRSSRGLSRVLKETGIDALHPKNPILTPRLVRRCHRIGLRVHVWVVNRRDRLSELKAMGVDGVMTDDPNIFQ